MAGRPWIVYVRVSTDEQARDGVSLDVQRAACCAVLAGKGQASPLVLTDPGYSGKDLSRPAMKELLRRVDAGGVAGIAIWKLDRLTRSLRDLLDLVERLRKQECDLLSVQESIDTSGPIGRFTLHLMGALAQLEREQIGERVRAAKRHLTAQGYFSGGKIPLGCVVTGESGRKMLARDPDTADLVAPLWAMVAAGATLGDCIAHLDRAGVRPRKTAQHVKTGVWSLLHRKDVVGVLVDQATYDLAHRTMASRWAPGKPSRRMQEDVAPGHAPASPRVWALRGIAHCGGCGALLVGVHAGRGRRAYLRCGGRIRHGRDHCARNDLPAEAVERGVAAAVRQVLKEDPAILAALAAAREENGGATAGEPAEIAERRAQIAALTLERDRIAQQLARVLDVIATSDTTAAGRALVGRVEGLQRAHDGIAAQVAAAQAALDATLRARHDAVAQLRALRQLADDLPTLPAEQLAAALSAILSRASIHPDAIDIELHAGIRPAPTGSGLVGTYPSTDCYPVGTAYVRRISILTTRAAHGRIDIRPSGGRGNLIQATARARDCAGRWDAAS